MKSVSTTGALATVLLLAVGACAGPGTSAVYFTDFTAGYDRESLRTAMSRAPLLVETYGAPQGGTSAEDVAQTTALALRRYGSPWLPKNYTASAADAGTTPYHLRVAYDVPNGFIRQDLCTAGMNDTMLQHPGTKSDGGTARVVMNLCRGETAIASGEGGPGSDVQPGSDGFARFIGQMGRAVMPRRNPVMQDDCIFVLCD